MIKALAIENLTDFLTFPFREEDWQQTFLIGSLVMLSGYFIPVLPWFVLVGYYLQIKRRSIAGEAERLPRWGEWEALLTDGLQGFGAQMIYTLPVIMLFVVGTLTVSLAQLPLVGLFLDPYTPELRGTWLMISTILSLLGIGAFGLAALFSLPLGLITPPAIAHLAAHRSFGAAFRVREWWPIFRANLSGFLLAYLLLMVGYFAMMLVMQILFMTVVLCWAAFLVLAPVGFYLYVISATLYGRAYRVGLEKLSV